jgi:hypothetical protein
MKQNKCHKCDLVNGLGDHLCRRCGAMLGMSVGKVLAEEAKKVRAPRYLFLLPFLILALGFAYWSSEIKKGAIHALNLDKEEWHQLTLDPKVSSKDALKKEEAPIYKFPDIKLPPIQPIVRYDPHIGPNPYAPPRTIMPEQPPPPPPGQPAFKSPQ